MVRCAMDADDPQVTSHPIPDDRREAVVSRLARLGLVGGDAIPTSRRLLDSFDARLAEAGLRAVAVCAGGPPAHDRSGAGVRLMVSGGRGGVATVELPAAPAWPADLPAGPLRNRLAELLDVRTLLPVVELKGVEQLWRGVDPDGRTVAEVSLVTDVVVTAGELMLPVDDRASAVDTATADDIAMAPGLPRAIAEVRAVRGEAAVAARIRSALADEGVVGIPDPAVVMVADLAGIDRTGRGSRLEIDVDRRMPALDGYREVFRALLAVVDANRAGAAAAVDPEFLHDLRVAVRRTRSVLRHARRVIPDEIRDRARDGFGRLGTLTGDARDLDVQVLDWSAMSAGFDPVAQSALEPVLAHVADLREAAHDEVRAGLADPATDELLDWWRDWLTTPLTVDQVDGRDAGRRLARVVAGHLERAQGRLLRDARAIDDLSPADHLHQLRKDAKALRYLFECFAPILPERPRKRFVRRLKSFQDLLGTHQDAEVHAHRLADVAHDVAARGASVDTLLAIGRLIEVHDRRRVAMRSRFADEFAVYDDATTHEAFAAVVGELRS